MLEFTKYFLYFMIYGFFGYICEVVYVAICTKKITNRGYLYGPIVPIYAYGAIGMILALNWVYALDQWWCPILVFVLGFVLTSALEYATSWVMELIFHMRWWDYSDKFGNINGRVCLRNSSMFGALVVIVIYLIHPYVVVKAVDLLLSGGEVLFYVTAGILLEINIVDTIFSTIKHVNIAKLLRKLESMAQAAVEEIKEKGQEAASFASEKATQLKSYISETKVAKKISSIQVHYPSMKIRPRLNKARVSISEFIEKIKEKL